MTCPRDRCVCRISADHIADMPMRCDIEDMLMRSYLEGGPTPRYREGVSDTFLRIASGTLALLIAMALFMPFL